MLVLTRKIDQGIVIAGNIVVRVLGVERDRVKIGISAPLSITVLRQELLERDANGSSKEGEPGASLSHAAKSEDVSRQT
jgi:carbon storage regulator